MQDQWNTIQQARLQTLLVGDKLQLGYQASGRLADVGERRSRRGSGRRSSVVAIIQMQDIDWEEERLATPLKELTRIEPLRKAAPYKVCEADVLLCLKGRNLKAVGLAGTGLDNDDSPAALDVLAVSCFAILRPKKGSLVPGYLAWYLNSPAGQKQIAGLSRGKVNNPFLSIVDLKDAEIPLPPYPIQIRIGELADAVRNERRELLAYLDCKRKALTTFCEETVRLCCPPPAKGDGNVE